MLANGFESDSDEKSAAGPSSTPLLDLVGELDGGGEVV